MFIGDASKLLSDAPMPPPDGYALYAMRSSSEPIPPPIPPLPASIMYADIVSYYNIVPTKNVGATASFECRRFDGYCVDV